jgi:lipid II:glycine glycyltransferase (peptidoglycan interpeptide bridge formation enzyme)
MSDELAYLTQANMDLQMKLDIVREERNQSRNDHAQTTLALSEALEVIKEKNAIIDRLQIHLQQGVEL